MTNSPNNDKSDPALQPWEGSSAFLSQGRHWSSALIWLFSTLFGLTFIWAFTAKIDQTVTVPGRLQPSGSVKEVESPSAGVISKVYVNDGDVVSVSSPLFDVEAKGLASRREALLVTQQLLRLQASSLKGILDSQGDPSRFPLLPSIPQVADLKLQQQLATARQQTQQIRSRLIQITNQLNSREKTLDLQQGIAADIKPLFDAGAMARNQYLQQLNQVQIIRSEVASLQEERQKVLGEAASQLNQINRQLINLDAELVALKETISYRTIRAPIAGRVFDVSISPATVVNADQVMMKLVPDNRLQASVDITNRDIGFMSVGLPVTVAVDSFPSGEFGYITGSLTSLGSDALPPDPLHPSWYFPATVSLDQQIVESGEQKLNLQSGMSITANIKLRSRPVITLLTDLFTKQLDGLKRFR